MTQLDPAVLTEVLDMLNELADDWEYDGPVTPDSYFLADLGLESLDLVVLGTMLQQRYGMLPFAEYLAEVGERPVEQRDVTVNELIAFVTRHGTMTAVPGGSNP